jgi:hypothetical protein
VESGRSWAAGTAVDVVRGGHRRWLRGAAVAAAVVGLGATAGAGVWASASSRPSRRGAVTTTRTALSGVTARAASATPGTPVAITPAADARPVSRARRLREFRRMVVALYRIPGDGSAGAFGGDPIHQMWHTLAEQYGSRAAAQQLDQQWYLAGVAPAMWSPRDWNAAGSASAVTSPRE